MPGAWVRRPALGAAIRHEWVLEPDFLTVNHGSYGATPKFVMAAQQDWRDRMERQPTRFMTRILPPAIRSSAGRLARFLGADPNDLAFVENATVGCNAVLRSLDLRGGDEVVVLDQSYHAIKNAIRYVTGRSGARVVIANLPFPRPNADDIVSAVGDALTSRTRLVVLDHITSPSALVLPVERLIAACHDHDVPVLIDGAHAPGQVAVDLHAIDADWYVGTCHKWLMAPKGCGFIWARADRQDIHPVTISHGFGQGFLEEFDYTGTRDPTAFLSIDAALDFHERLGGAELRSRNIRLAADATALLARRLNTETGASGPLAGAMGLVRLPVAGAATPERMLALRGRMLDAGTDAPLHVLAGGIWLRLSAQAYNELDDYEKLSELVARIIRDWE